MLDNFAHICKTGTDAPVPPEGLRYPVQLEDLTNDVQWPSSVMKVRGVTASTQQDTFPLSVLSHPYSPVSILVIAIL